MDYGRLGLFLRLLGAPIRLELLRRLQVPLAVSEIRIPPARREQGRTPERPMSRQAIERHLKALEAAGLVRARAGRREGRPVVEFVVSHARVFVVAEELRRLSIVRPALEGTPHTEGRSTHSRIGWRVVPPTGPALYAGSGPLEGTFFPLEGPGPWTIGRGADADISLSFDPFVSRANARLTRDPSFGITSIPGARNGTRVNWRHLADAERVALTAGDAIGVGRTLLVFRGARAP